MATTIAAAVAVPWAARRFLASRGQVVLGVLLGTLAASSYIIWVVAAVVGGTFSWRDHLPLHLCWLANLALPIVMGGRQHWLMEIVYYWGIAAGLQATVTPTVQATYPEWEFWRYVLGHNGMVVALVYAVVVYRYRPTLRGIAIAFAAGNLLLLAAIPVNLVAESNYLFLCHKPRGRTLLDWMGPWPWYVVAGEGLALLHFVLAYLPFGAAAKIRGSIPKD